MGAGPCRLSAQGTGVGIPSSGDADLDAALYDAAAEFALYGDHQRTRVGGVGRDKKALAMAVKNAQITERHTALAEQLQK